jgi:hypothetical protein
MEGKSNTTGRTIAAWVETILSWYFVIVVGVIILLAALMLAFEVLQWYYQNPELVVLAGAARRASMTLLLSHLALLSCVELLRDIKVLLFYLLPIAVISLAMLFLFIDPSYYFGRFKCMMS